MHEGLPRLPYDGWPCSRRRCIRGGRTGVRPFGPDVTTPAAIRSPSNIQGVKYKHNAPAQRPESTSRRELWSARGATRTALLACRLEDICVRLDPKPARSVRQRALQLLYLHCMEWGRCMELC
jgi:hypothetical protein